MWLPNFIKLPKHDIYNSRFAFMIAKILLLFFKQIEILQIDLLSEF